MTPQWTRDQFCNVLAFLILIGDGRALLGKAPEYIVEKWDRYIRHLPPDGPAWQWGLDSGNMALFDDYRAVWKYQLDELFPTTENEGGDADG